MTTAHELAADWEWMNEYSGFQVVAGGVVWEEAEYIGERLRIARLNVGTMRQSSRYVDPETPVTLVK